MHLCQLFLLTLHYRNKKMQIKDMIMIEKFKQIRAELNPENKEWLSKTEIKKRLQIAYDKVGIFKIANASDIQIFFDAVEKQRRVEGKQTNGYLIINK